MNKLLPADVKALALSAWLFYSERGFSTNLIHIGDAADVELRITYEDSQQLPRCPVLEQAPFSCEITRIGYSYMVCHYFIPEVFI